jgi:hypothetical protein
MHHRGGSNVEPDNMGESAHQRLKLCERTTLRIDDSHAHAGCFARAKLGLQGQLEPQAIGFGGQVLRCHDWWDRAGADRQIYGGIRDAVIVVRLIVIVPLCAVSGISLFVPFHEKSAHRR